MEKRFPRYLNSPIQVLWLESDELAVFFIALFVALMFESWLLWTLPVFGPYFYGRFKRNHPRGFLRHCLYFTGLKSMRGYPTYFEREFLE